MAVRVVLRRAAFALVCVLISSGCQSDERAFVVKAVAAGVPSLAPFFDEDAGLGQDAGVRSRPAPGGVQQGDTPGLYGGTREPEICDVDRLRNSSRIPRMSGKHRPGLPCSVSPPMGFRNISTG